MATNINLDFSFDDRSTTATPPPEELEAAVLAVKSDLEDHDISVREMYAEREGTLGPEWLPVLTAVLSGPAILLAIRAIRDVLKVHVAKERHLKVTIKKDGHEVTVTAQNIGDLSEHQIAASLKLPK